jgi:NADH:ubiquinone oxidoreductase subunit F (NADH-binding)
VVVANGCEGEPVSSKDHALLRLAPHLVIDGAVLAARAVGAAQIYLCVHRGSGDLSRLRRALAERPADEPRIHLVEVPARYVSSEESALVRFLNTGDARPTAKPPRPFESGVGRRPTLIDNVETLAQLALIARHGPDWFRGAGTADSPGTTLVTLSGALHRPGVYEVPLGTAIGSVLGLAGGATGVLQAVLVGGYGGAWLPLPAAESVPLSHEGLRAAGGVLGVGALVALPAGACAIAETAGILRYLAGESARQCGPCMFGLPAIASDMADLVNQGSPAILARLRTRLGVIPGRGACGHPDGAARLAASALQVFEAEAREHAFGRPCFWSKQPTVTAAPLPAPRPEWR